MSTVDDLSAAADSAYNIMGQILRSLKMNMGTTVSFRKQIEDLQIAIENNSILENFDDRIAEINGMLGSAQAFVPLINPVQAGTTIPPTAGTA